MFHISMFVFLSILILAVIKPDLRNFKWNNNTFIWLFVFIGVALLATFIWFLNQIDFLELLRTSKVGEKWGTIGSMAAGCFTGTAAFFTLATLLYTKQQNDELRTIRVKEAQLLEFDIFIKHQQQVEETLLRIDCKYLSGRFKSRIELYFRMFPENTAAACKLQLSSREFRQNFLYELKVKLETIISTVSELDNQSQYYEDCHAYDDRYLFLNDMIEIYKELGIPLEVPPQDFFTGSILVEGQVSTFLNAYSLPDEIERICYIVNELLKLARQDRVVITAEQRNAFANPCIIYGCACKMRVHSERGYHDMIRNFSMHDNMLSIHAKIVSKALTRGIDDENVIKTLNEHLYVTKEITNFVVEVTPFVQKLYDDLKEYPIQNARTTKLIEFIAAELANNKDEAA